MPRWKALPEELDPQIHEFASQLRGLVDRSGLSIATVADRTGYSKSSWERYLNGRLLPPRGEARALAEVTGTDVRHLATMWELAERAWSRSEMRHDVTMEAIQVAQARAALGEITDEPAKGRRRGRGKDRSATARPVAEGPVAPPAAQPPAAAGRPAASGSPAASASTGSPAAAPAESTVPAQRGPGARPEPATEAPTTAVPSVGAGTPGPSGRPSPTGGPARNTPAGDGWPEMDDRTTVLRRSAILGHGPGGAPTGTPPGGGATTQLHWGTGTTQEPGARSASASASASAPTASPAPATAPLPKVPGSGADGPQRDVASWGRERARREAAGTEARSAGGPSSGGSPSGRPPAGSEALTTAQPSVSGVRPASGGSGAGVPGPPAGAEPPGPPAPEIPGSASRGSGKRRVTMFLVGAVGALVLIAGAVFAFDRMGSEKEAAPAKPSPTAKDPDLPKGVKCQGADCSGKDPEDMGCGGQYAKTSTSGWVGQSYVEVRYSKVCRAAWARIQSAVKGDKLVITSGEQSETDTVGTTNDAYTAMVSVTRGKQARACATLAAGGKGCTK
ncbi:DUF2690 domain-containing protein [Streptomyces sp. AJS327]|uniref:helix-turn-helix domain-containing protein n=1 Tax=Streptomyces sp. AJS327 TaxID=2545265 RepID=UPI0015DEE8A9|nr:XRE family transcriptional regulator [Streptomyces sp. AJS327]MBA0054252.1 DUF2690 domain-containing protein [Streptomyces sp. AJS327]